MFLSDRNKFSVFYRKDNFSLALLMVGLKPFSSSDEQVQGQRVLWILFEQITYSVNFSKLPFYLFYFIQYDY
jgi:hypothetical protein